MAAKAPTQQVLRREARAQTLSKEARIRFGQQLRDARIAAGMTQAEIGRITGKGQTYTSDIEIGRRNLTLETIYLMANAVGLEVEFIVRPRSTKATPKS